MSERAQYRQSPGRGRGLLGSGLWVLGSRVVVALTQVIFLGLLARLMTPADMGVYFVVANLVIISSTFAQMGVPQVVVKRSAEALEIGGTDRVRPVLQASLLLALAAAGIAGLLFVAGLGEWLAASVFARPSMMPLLLLATAWLVFIALQRSVGEAFRGLHDMRSASIFAGAVSGIVNTLVLVALVLWRGDCSLMLAVGVSAGGMGVSLLLSVVLLQRRVHLFQTPVNWPTGDLVRLAVPIFFATLGNVVLNRADIWLLGMFADDHQTALYGGAARVIGVLGTAQLIAVSLTVPVIAQLNQRGDRRELQRVIQLVPTVLALPTFVLILALLIWGDALLALLYGDNFYAGGYRVLVILALGQAVVLAGGVGLQVLLMTNQQKAVMLISVLCTTVAVLGTLLTTARWGIDGVACWFAGALAGQALLCLLWCKVRLGLNTWLWPPSLREIGGLRQLIRRPRAA